MHQYVDLDYDRVIAALDQLEPVERFITAVAAIERNTGDDRPPAT